MLRSVCQAATGLRVGAAADLAARPAGAVDRPGQADFTFGQLILNRDQIGVGIGRSQLIQQLEHLPGMAAFAKHNENSHRLS